MALKVKSFSWYGTNELFDKGVNKLVKRLVDDGMRIVDIKYAATPNWDSDTDFQSALIMYEQQAPGGK